MKKEKKQLIKKFKVVIEDLLDNYENYTEEEKAKIKEIFQKVAELNKVLDKYDEVEVCEGKAATRKTGLDRIDADKQIYWVEYLAAYGQFFGPMGF